MKIHSLEQLKAEKKHLAKRRAELETELHYDWQDIKETARPKISGFVLSKIFKRNPQSYGADFVVSGISLLAAIFTKRMIEKTKAKIARVFRKN